MMTNIIPRQEEESRMTRYLINSRGCLRLTAVTTALTAALAASPALAQTATGNLAVSATVTDNCTVTTSPVAFGNVDATSGAATDATGGIAVTCTNGTTWSAAADAGAGSGATLASRKMTNGANLLNYALYTDSARTTLWGDGAGGTTETIDGTGTGAAQAVTVYARVPGSQSSAPSGSYSDTVVVTVTYP
jgi:spore coat protein U-like protein